MGLGQGNSQIQLAIWECPLPMGFTYCEAPSKIYHEPNLHRSRSIEMVRILCLFINSEREILPSYKCKNPPTIE
jgi:hypothetical protein